MSGIPSYKYKGRKPQTTQIFDTKTNSYTQALFDEKLGKFVPVVPAPITEHSPVEQPAQTNPLTQTIKVAVKHDKDVMAPTPLCDVKPADVQQPDPAGLLSRTYFTHQFEAMQYQKFR